MAIREAPTRAKARAVAYPMISSMAALVIRTFLPDKSSFKDEMKSYVVEWQVAVDGPLERSFLVEN
jgi:uncharacterized membrane protein